MDDRERKTLRALMMKERRANERLHKPTEKLAHLVATMVLMKAPWSYIAVVAKVCSGTWKQRQLEDEWTADRIKHITQETITVAPALLTQAYDANNPTTHRATTWLAELQLSLWILEQNTKGIAVPAQGVIDHYLASWGMGPHQFKLTTHLHRFTKEGSRRQWTHAFRKRWGFHYAACRHGAPLLLCEIEKKRPSGRTLGTPSGGHRGPSFEDMFGTSLGSRNGNQNWFQKWDLFLVIVGFLT